MPQARAEFDRILDGRQLSTVFQPVVDLASSEVVGFEALMRGPLGSRFHRPEKLFAYAYRTGRTVELDWACQAAAFRAALDAELPRNYTLFTNVEPAALGTECPPDLLDTVLAGIDRYNVVIELTERYLVEDPGGVLDAVAIARSRGLGVALDDVGVEPASLAMMPLVHPDVIKLDLSLIQGRPDMLVARTVNGVLAEVERTGATVIAEGIESPRHAAMAYAMGATLGQGWRHGRPEPLPFRLPRSSGHPVRLLRLEFASKATPYEIIATQRPTRTATRQLLLWLSRHLELQAADPAEPGVLVSCFPGARQFKGTVKRRYTDLASGAVLVAVLGRGIPAEPAPKLRGTSLDADDPLADEWVVVVVGANYGAALIAQTPRHEHAEQEYDFAMTYDRGLVIAAAQSLIHRIHSPRPPALHRPTRSKTMPSTG